MMEKTINPTINPTQLAQNMAYWTFDLNDAIRYLKERFPIRKINEVLMYSIKQKAQERNMSENEIKAILRSRLGNQNVNNWLNGNVNSISREKAIQIAFALHMTYEETETFIKKCWLDGFYMRDVRDVIYRHGLENGWCYKKTDKLIKIFAFLDQANTNPDASGVIHDNEFTKHLNTLYTGSVKTKDDLIYFIRQNEQFFGSFKRKAYIKFKELYDGLKQEWDDLAGVDYELDSLTEQSQVYDRDTVSMEELNDVIVKGIPEYIKHGKFSADIRRLITEHIPSSRSTMSEIINQYERNGLVTQVDRKLLLLAYLASDDGATWEYQKGKELEAFMEHLSVINIDLLEPLGMATLDPRHPFDWIIMYSLSCSYFGYAGDADDRIRELLESI